MKEWFSFINLPPQKRYRTKIVANVYISLNLMYIITTIYLACIRTPTSVLICFIIGFCILPLPVITMIFLPWLDGIISNRDSYSKRRK